MGPVVTAVRVNPDGSVTFVVNVRK